METLIESIRIAVATDATDEQRAAGAQACRTIATALESKPGEAIVAPALPTTAPQLAQMISALRGVPPEQLLDLAIARLRAALPPDATTPAVVPLRFNLVPLLKP